MNKIGSFKISGTASGNSEPVSLDEIVIAADSDTLVKIGVFLIQSAHDLDVNEFDHVHLQDIFDNYSEGKHADIIVHKKELGLLKSSAQE